MVSAQRLYALDLLKRIWRFVLVFAVVYVVAGLSFYLLNDSHYTLFDSMYWSIVTLGTVGYGDVVPTTTPAKVLASIVIVTQIFLLAYLLSMIMTAVSEESERRALGTYGTDLKGHIAVLGYSAVGQAAVRELLAQDQKVAVVTDRAEEVQNIRALAGPTRLFVTFGGPAEAEMLKRVNVGDAHSVIVCTADDATNMIGALNVRAMNPNVRIVVSVGRPELRDTLRAAGVTYVASPADMGGRLCASAAFEPDVANAIDDLTAADVRADIQEYLLSDRTPVSRSTFGEAEVLVRQKTGCIVIGLARRGASGEYETSVAPSPHQPVAPGDALVIVGSIEGSKRLRQWFGVEQGR